MSLQLISLKGERDVWSKFVKKVKLKHQTVWAVLKQSIDAYLKKK